MERKLIDAYNTMNDLLYGKAYIPDELAEYIKQVFENQPSIDSVKQRGLLTQDEIECFRAYIADLKDPEMAVIWGNSDWCDIYKKIVNTPLEVECSNVTFDLLDADGFHPEPIHILQMQYGVVCHEKVDEIIFKEVAKLTAEMKVDCTVLIDESRLKRVLELGLQAFREETRKEGDENAERNL